jgi:hypothetical protein
MGKSTTLIGYIDTGFDYGNPVIEGQYAVNPSEDLNGNGRFDPWPAGEIRNGVPGDLNGVDEDGNGYVDDVAGYDFTDQPDWPGGGDDLEEDPIPWDDHGHGTIVASVMVAKAYDADPLFGVCPECRVVPLRAFSASGVAEDDDIARAIYYAVQRGVRILNLSFGDIYPSWLMHDMIRYARTKGILIVASAGNGGGDNPHYPSDFPEVMSVSASDYDPETGSEFLWFLSSYGNQVDLCAPGSSIYATYGHDTTGNALYAWFSGTSLSAPMVSGVAGLLLSLDSTLTPDQLHTILVTGTKDLLQPGWDPYTGHGRLDAAQSLHLPWGGTLRLDGPLVWQNGKPLPVVVTALHPLFSALYVEFQHEKSTQWQSLYGPEWQQHVSDTLFWWDTDGISYGEHWVRLRMRLQNQKDLVVVVPFLKDTADLDLETMTLTTAWYFQKRWGYCYGKWNRRVTTYLDLVERGDTLRFRYDKGTRRFEFPIELKGTDSLSFVLEAQRLVQKKRIALGSHSFQPYSIPIFPLAVVSHLPISGYSVTADLDQDGIQEVVISRYTDALGYGAVETYRYDGQNWVQTDSLPIPMIPKDIQDMDGDGYLELLASYNQTIYLWRQEQMKGWRWTLLDSFPNMGYPACFLDVDGDGLMEILLKDYRDYYLYAYQGRQLVKKWTLSDPTNDYVGSTAPGCVYGDLDGDLMPDLFIADYDGDIWYYEWDGNQWQVRSVYQTNLGNGALTLRAGNVDQDPATELVWFVPNQMLRDEEAYEDPSRYARLFVFEVSNDSLQLEYSAHFIPFLSGRFQSLEVADLTRDGQAEILIGFYPSLYVFQFDGYDLRPVWYHYGALVERFSLLDGDGDGYLEFSVSDGYQTKWLEYGSVERKLNPPKWLQGYSYRGQVFLSWDSVPGVQGYVVWRTRAGDTLIYAIDTVTTTSYSDSVGIKKEVYLYSVTSYHGDSVPAISVFPDFVWVGLDTLHLVSVTCDSDHIFLHFSSDDSLRSEYAVKVDTIEWFGYRVGGSTLVIPGGFMEAMAGHHTICFNSDFETWWHERLDTVPTCVSISCFSTDPTAQPYLYIRRWERLGEKEVQLYLSARLDPTSVRKESLFLSPYGEIESVQYHDQDSSLWLRLTDVVIGPVGYVLRIRLGNGLKTLDGYTVRRGYGDEVAIWINGTGDGIYVYPNPVQNVAITGSVMFANLPPDVEIDIFTESGRWVTKLRNEIKAGGMEWDLRDVSGKPIHPGVYVFVVTPRNSSEMLYKGKFAVVE